MDVISDDYNYAYLLQEYLCECKLYLSETCANNTHLGVLLCVPSAHTSFSILLV